MQGIQEGDTAYFLAKMPKRGKSLAFLTCDVYDSKQVLCFTGKHVKAFVHNKKRNDSTFTPKL